MLAGVILVLLGVARLGRLMQFVPHPVTTGFTMGIAVVIGLLQLKDVLGVTLPPHRAARSTTSAALWTRAPGSTPGTSAIALVTLALLARRCHGSCGAIPAPLVALPSSPRSPRSSRALRARRWHVHVATIGSQLHVRARRRRVGRGIPPLPPLPVVPWHHAARASALDYHTSARCCRRRSRSRCSARSSRCRSAVVADGMSGTRHDPNAELIALGIAQHRRARSSAASRPTGALARTATNIRAGARSPLAAALHGVFILACTIALAPLVAYLPMAALAALLLVVARNMSEARHFVRLARIAPRADVIVMLTCFGLTVAFDMVIAVTVGVVLAALLFMRRMAVLTASTLETPRARRRGAGRACGVYEIAGPLFFGAAKTAMEALHAVGEHDHTSSSTWRTCRRWTRPAWSRSSPCSTACTARRSR